MSDDGWREYLSGLRREVQMICIWSSCCHCYPIISCFIKIQTQLIFLVPAYLGYPGKEAIKWVSVWHSIPELLQIRHGLPK